MALPEISMRGLLESGAHFGHQTHRWNPKMERYIFGSRSNIHIIDLSQTLPLLHQALVKVREVSAVGRPRAVRRHQAPGAGPRVHRRQALRAEYYVNHRWLGGTLTNWRTVSGSIARLRELENLDAQSDVRTKKELLGLTRERDKLELSLGGIKDMGGIPDLMFVIDTNKESIAIQEARKLNIPVGGDPGHQLGPRRRRLPGAGQRRCGPRPAALLRPDRRRRHRRAGPGAGGFGRGPGRFGRLRPSRCCARRRPPSRRPPRKRLLRKPTPRPPSTPSRPSRPPPEFEILRRGPRGSSPPGD